MRLRKDGRIDTIETGIYVRAQDENGKWGPHDICELDNKSLRMYMDNISKHSLRVCLLLALGHDPRECKL